MMTDTSTFIRQFCSLLNQPNFQLTQKDRIVQMGQEFINIFTVDQTSNRDGDNNGYSGSIPSCPTELKSILASISMVEFDRSNEIVELILLTVAKLLLRSHDNRSSLAKPGMELILKILHQRLRLRKAGTIIAETCGIILNACYDTDNVDHLCETNNGVLMLLNCIHHREEQIVATALGALQAVCFAPMGRRTFRQNLEVLSKLVSQLTHPLPVIRARALGTLHNLSVDTVAIVPLVDTGCVGILVQIIQDSDEEICALALGTLQNLTRESNAKGLAYEAGALPIVARLLMSASVQCQVAALATFMNLTNCVVGQDSSSLHSLLAEAIALGAINSCIFDGKNEIG